LEQAVLQLRRRYPRWGKDKLAVLLRGAGHAVSVSMVGRILTRLKRRGLLVEPVSNAISARRPASSRPYAIRKPRDYVPRVAGDLVEVDTLGGRPLPGMVVKHFTARDVISRWDVIEVRSRATATTAAAFLGTLVARMPFAVRATQVDGSSEFHAAFEAECQRRGLRLFMLLSRSPKLNGAVERAQGTHTEEFYELHPFDRSQVRASTARPAPGSASTTPCARIRRSAISLRLRSCVAHAAKLKLRGLTALCARVRRGQGSPPATNAASLPLTPTHLARHNPAQSKNVT
jgi:hypothetical protein